MRYLGHADFGVAHGGRVVAIDRTEIALAIHQHVAQRKILRHSHNRFVHRAVTVRVVFADHVTHNPRRLFIRPVPVVVELVHGEQNPPVHRFQAVPCIGQGAPHNHAHGVIEIAAAHFLFQTDGQSFFGELGHGEDVGRKWNAILRSRPCSKPATLKQKCGFVLQATVPRCTAARIGCGTID